MDCSNYPGFKISPGGRQGIGVVQPESGIDYTLVNPSEDIRYLIADITLILDYPDHNQAGLIKYQHPYRISYLYGLGCVNYVFFEGGSGLPAHIVVVNKANDVVFSSYLPSYIAGAPRFKSYPLGDDHWRYEWWSEWNFCGVTTHQSWAEEDPDKRHYLGSLFPERATIDARAVKERPRSVKRIWLDWPGTEIDPARKINIYEEAAGGGKTNLVIANGFNTELTTAVTATGHEITLAAVAGSGAGKYGNCLGIDRFPRAVTSIVDTYPDPEIPPVEPPPIVSINGQTTKDGSALIAMKDCLWIKKPVIIETVPVTDVDENGNSIIVTDPETNEPILQTDVNGVPLTTALGVDSDTAGHAALGGDCAPCCECQDYKDVALTMNAYASQYNLIGTRVSGIKDIHEQNILQWLDARHCTISNPLRLLLVAQRCPYMDIVMMVCNPCNDACLNVKNLTLNITTNASPAAVAILQPGYTALFSSDVNGRPVPVNASAANQFTVDFDTIKRGDSAYVRFRVKMSVASEYSITGTLTGLLNDDTPILTGCDSDEDQETRTAATAIAQQALQCDALGKTTLP